MLSIKHHVEYLADARASALVEARRVLLEARARLAQSRLLNEVEPSRENRAFLLEAERAVVHATINERALSTTRDASRSH
jgi:hypothetical protein